MLFTWIHLHGDAQRQHVMPDIKTDWDNKVVLDGIYVILIELKK